MTEHEQERMRQLLRKTFHPVDAGAGAEPMPDLWPEMLKRLESRHTGVPWLDWALLGGVAMLLVLSPRVIPLLVYYL
jgi:hypothetical protein